MNVTPLISVDLTQLYRCPQGQAAFQAVLCTLDRICKVGQRSTNAQWLFVRINSHKSICSTSHLRVSSQDLLMGQQVKLPLLTPSMSHGMKSRGDDRSSKGFEYPSGLEDLKPLQRKAVYMTETTVASKFVLAHLARSIYDSRGGRALSGMTLGCVHLSRRAPDIPLNAVIASGAKQSTKYRCQRSGVRCQ